MADTPKVYVICDANCKWEGMTKEQILTAITQAVSTGEVSDVDTGFVQTIKTINGIGLKFFVGTQSEYDALSDEDKQNLFAIITNDVSKDTVLSAVNELSYKVGELRNNYLSILNGEVTVGKATNATKAARADNATNALTATNADNVFVITRSVNKQHLVAFVEGSREQQVYGHNGLQYNPYTKVLTVENIEGNITNADHADHADHANEATNATNDGSGYELYGRKTLWSGTTVIEAGGYARVVTTESAALKYIIIQTDTVRTFPMYFDTSKYVSVTKGFDCLGQNFEVVMDNQNANSVRINNKGNIAITIQKIFAEP